MAEMQNFNHDFVKRTIDILDSFSKNTDLEVTLLLNCLLGMVALPIESEKNKANKKVKKFKEDCVSKMKELSEIKIQSCSDDTFFDNIRNSIAHLNINVENKNKKIENIELKNLEHGEMGRCTLKIVISPENLKIFMKYVANEYLNRF